MTFSSACYGNFKNKFLFHQKHNEKQLFNAIEKQSKSQTSSFFRYSFFMYSSDSN